MSSPPSGREYVLRHSPSELHRLIVQADSMRRLTEGLLRDAGISSGMRVLDLGCGAGDVSFLIAELTGKTGEVVGIDRAEAALAMARRRASEQGLTNASFVSVPFENMEFGESFDASVGRLILHHQADPVLTVRQAAAQVKAGGLVIFHELDLSLRAFSSWPPLPLYERCLSWITETQSGYGLHVDIGKRLYHTFRAAGLPAPEMRLERTIGAEWRNIMAEIAAEMIRTMLPQVVKLGVASENEIQIDTLAQRMQAELAAADAITIGTPLVGAWCRKPDLSKSPRTSPQS